MKKILFRLLMALGAFILILVINYVVINIISTKVTEGTPINTSGSGQTALLVIDVQEGTTGVTSTTESYQKQSDGLIRNLNQMVKEARDKNWTVVYIQSEIANPLINILNNSMARGSVGATLDKRLDVNSDLIVTKRRSDSFSHTNLDQILEENQVEKLVVVGLDAAHCVNSTIQAALNRGYEVAVIPDGIIAGEEAVKERMMGEFRDMGVEFIE